MPTAQIVPAAKIPRTAGRSFKVAVPTWYTAIMIVAVVACVVAAVQTAVVAFTTDFHEDLYGYAWCAVYQPRADYYSDAYNESAAQRLNEDPCVNTTLYWSSGLPSASEYVEGSQCDLKTILPNYWAPTTTTPDMWFCNTNKSVSDEWCANIYHTVFTEVNDTDPDCDGTNYTMISDVQATIAAHLDDKEDMTNPIALLTSLPVQDSFTPLLVFIVVVFWGCLILICCILPAACHFPQSIRRTANGIEVKTLVRSEVIAFDDIERIAVVKAYSCRDMCCTVRKVMDLLTCTLCTGEVDEGRPTVFIVKRNCKCMNYRISLVDGDAEELLGTPAVTAESIEMTKVERGTAAGQAKNAEGENDTKGSEGNNDTKGSEGNDGTGAADKV